MNRLSKDRWLDLALTAAVFTACEVEILTSKHRSGPVVLNVLLMAAITLPTFWRRRWPLAYAALVFGLAVLMTATLTSIIGLTAPLYLLFLPAYTVAAGEERTRARAGLTICVGGAWAVNAIAQAGVKDYLFTAGLVAASWTTGRALRARRMLNEELEHRAERIAAERESRERLAVADERTRIARELHAVVAGSVTGMVVQTEVAQQLLGADPEGADAVMAAVEDAGRQALAEMRRILGVLRRIDETTELTPQPGVGQIHRLVEHAREQHREVTLEVEGDPGPLPASVDLGVYRILEEALATAEPGPLQVRLRFAPADVELAVAGRGATADWPTLAMQERVALCDGALEADGHGLRVRVPRAFQEAVA